MSDGDSSFRIYCHVLKAASMKLNAKANAKGLFQSRHRLAREIFWLFDRGARAMLSVFCNIFSSDFMISTFLKVDRISFLFRFHMPARVKSIA